MSILCLQMLFSDKIIKAKGFCFVFNGLELFFAVLWNSFKMLGGFFVNGNVSW